MVSAEFSGVQGVSMLNAFKIGPPIGGATICYPNLEKVAREAKQIQYDLLDDFWLAEPGSIEEEKYARAAALGYLVLTAHQLQNVNPTDQPLISDRLTQSSIEIYGAPEPTEARKLIAAQRQFFAGLDSPDVDQVRLGSVLSTLDKALGSESVRLDQEEDYAEVADRLNGVIEARYGSVLSTFDELEFPARVVEGDNDSLARDINRIINLGWVKGLVDEGLRRLAEIDPDWREFTSELVNDSGMSASYKDRKVNIGVRGNYKPERLKPLFAHEVLGHLLRSVNGAKTGDGLMARNLPGNVDPEEGLCTLLEYAVGGRLADKVIDRYIDTALALGATGQPPLNRYQLHELHSNRQIVRAQAVGEPVNINDLKQGAWNHVDRIYRGSLGNHKVGVNTKDIVYYQGFRRMAEYIQYHLQQGRSIDVIYDYIMSGCFDPTNDRHRHYAAPVLPAGLIQLN